MNISDDTALQYFRGLVRNFSQPRFSEADFLQQQYAVIEAYVERFPVDEREFRALAWIEANARQYRQQWQMQAATGGRQMHANLGY